MKKSTIGVLGIGEIGKAIVGIFKDNFTIYKKDLKFDEVKNRKVDVLHICIPYSANFLSSVIAQISVNSPELVIIHSTIFPETTKKIYDQTMIPIVHSPVMGMHPNLRRDMLNFKKIVGPVNKKSARLAKIHLEKAGFKLVFVRSSLESEIGKLCDTTYYAWNIIFCKYVGELTRKRGVNFEDIYEKFNYIYNEGYRIAKPNVVRPILKFKKGSIGGHCVIPNAKILNKFHKSSLTEYILKTNQKA